MSPRGANVGGDEVARVESEDFHRLYLAARDADRKLATALRKAIREAGKPIVSDVRDQIDQIPSSGRHSTGVRQALKAGTRVAISTSARGAGAKFVTSPSKLPSAKRALARAMNKESFRRRVFGSDTWVQQAGHPYFSSTIYAHEPQVRAGIKQALEDVAGQLAEGTT